MIEEVKVANSGAWLGMEDAWLGCSRRKLIMLFNHQTQLLHYMQHCFLMSQRSGCPSQTTPQSLSCLCSCAARFSLVFFSGTWWTNRPSLPLYYATTCTVDLHQDARSCDYMRLWHTGKAVTVFTMCQPPLHSTASFAAVAAYHQCPDSVTGMKIFSNTVAHLTLHRLLYFAVNSPA